MVEEGVAALVATRLECHERRFNFPCEQRFRRAHSAAIVWVPCRVAVAVPCSCPEVEPPRSVVLLGTAGSPSRTRTTRDGPSVEHPVYVPTRATVLRLDAADALHAWRVKPPRGRHRPTALTVSAASKSEPAKAKADSSTQAGNYSPVSRAGCGTGGAGLTPRFRQSPPLITVASSSAWCTSPGGSAASESSAPMRGSVVAGSDGIKLASDGCPEWAGQRGLPSR